VVKELDTTVRLLEEVSVLGGLLEGSTSRRGRDVGIERDRVIPNQRMPQRIGQGFTPGHDQEATVAAHGSAPPIWSTIAGGADRWESAKSVPVVSAVGHSRPESAVRGLGAHARNRQRPPDADRLDVVLAV